MDFGKVNGSSRFEVWVAIAQELQPAVVAEIGVWRGDFAARILTEVNSIEQYFMVDPWRHLAAWNKPANRSDHEFEMIMEEALQKTAFAASRVEVLRGTTSEIVDRLPDKGIDLAYIDGDHTLRGITLDLGLVYPKMATGGVLGGDDFVPNVWQHAAAYEPTFVYPYSVYFADLAHCQIHALPHKQFAMVNDPSAGYSFTDHVGAYSDPTVSAALKGR